MEDSLRSVVDIEVTLPQKGRVSSFGPMARKPMAQVRLILDNDDDLLIVVPVRVGRILKDSLPVLPLEVDEAFDRIHALEAKACMSVLTEMLNRRDHSCEEARAKLKLYGYRDEEIDPCIVKAVEMRFLNDTRFASYFIEERKRRGWGRRKIELELRAKGVNAQDLPGYPDSFFSVDDDAQRADAILRRKSIPSQRAFEKLVRFLMGKGFSYVDASDAVKRRLAELGAR